MRRAFLQYGASLVLLLAFAAVTFDAETYGWLTRHGHQLTRGLGDRSHALVTAMYAVTAFGGGFVLSGIALLTGLAFAYRRRTWTPLLFLAVVLGGIKALTSVVKLLTARARPPADIGVYVEPTYAYPSGHASATTALCIAVAVLVAAVVRSKTGQGAAWAIAGAISAVMGVSRVVLGVHWPTDVLGGWLLGAAWALLCLAACRAICARRGVAFPLHLPLTRR